MKIALNTIKVAAAGGLVDWKTINLPQSKFSDIGGLLNGVVSWIIGFGGALAVIAIVYSGIMYITAGPDQAKAEAAKKNLTWAIIGLVIAILAIVIIQSIYPILSTEKTTL